MAIKSPLNKNAYKQLPIVKTNENSFIKFLKEIFIQCMKYNTNMETNALKNGIFSFIIPGLGQILQQDRQKGFAMLGGAVLIHIFIWFFMNNPLGSLINTAYHLYSGYDAYKNY